MQALPISINKHPIGYVFIALVGFGSISLIAALIYSLLRTGDLTEQSYYLLGFTAVIILLITLVQLYVYSLSYIQISAAGLRVKNWRTLFVSQDTEVGWGKVQDATWKTGSIWSLLFNYATLEVQTAGTTQYLTMTMIPNAEYWQAVIAAYANDTTDFSTVSE